MPTLDKTGLRIAGAGAAATALTLAAPAPAFAQTEYEHFNAYFHSSETDEPVEVLEYSQQQSAYIAVEGPDATQGDLIEITVDFSATPGVIEVTPYYEPRCEFAADVLTCVDDGTEDLSGTFFTLDLGLGEQGEPGDVADYTFTATANGEDEVTWDGRIQVSDDYEDHGGGEELPGDPSTENPGGDLEGTDYEFAYLDHLVTGADQGATVAAAPQIQVEGAPAEARVASMVWFTDSLDIDMWTDPDNAYDFGEMATGNAVALDEFDNCDRVYEGYLTCIVTDWTPEDGTTYEPSAPVQYVIEDEITDIDLSVYSAFDLNEELLAAYLADGDYDLEGADRFALSEVADDDVAPEDHFFTGEGWILFEASIEDVATENPDGSGRLPSTGDSTIVLVASAAAALIAGAVVFFLLRRRRTAATWE